jgi:hypothetical protein
MPAHRGPLAAVAAFALIAGEAAGPSCARRDASVSPPLLGGRPIRVDEGRKLLSWSQVRSPYAHVSRLAWQALETKFGIQENGLETWLAYSRFDPDDFHGVAWPHNPAGLYAMLADSAVLWYAFSGDEAAVRLVRKALDYQLDHGTTPPDWDWARVPYASAAHGDVDYRGADDAWCDFCGRGDGIGVIEPDKVGELGYAYAQFYELTGSARYREAAIACADALAKHVREGDDLRSPWPFRVYAQTNVAREEYSSNVVGALWLFDELSRLSLGDTGAYALARATALRWLFRVPMKNDAWSGYFEDIPILTDPSANPNQYSALGTARWLMAHPQDDPEWREHVPGLVAWAMQTFGGDTPNERGLQWGATVMSEQAADMAKMASHTARLGATAALWYQATGDAAARDGAERSLNWATYACDDRGIVAVGEDKNEGFWFSDGYGDYVRHFLVAMGAVPEWAPPGEIHVLRSTSVVTHVDYRPTRVEWTTFDGASGSAALGSRAAGGRGWATETLRLPSRPASVSVAGVAVRESDALDGDSFSVRAIGDGDFVVEVRHQGPGPVVVTTTPAAGRAPTPPAPNE